MQSEVAALICARDVYWRSSSRGSLNVMSQKVFLVVLLLFAFSIAAQTAASYPVGKGTIEGTVTGMSGRSVVYIETIQGKTFPAPQEHAVVDQQGMLFLPHILAVQQGTTVDFLNSDNVTHNVFWPSIDGDKKLGFNLSALAKGGQRSFKFDNAGVVPVLCNIHPGMAAFIVVSPTPYFAVTDAGGNYSIQDVPDGTYTLTVWHEGAERKSQEVRVAGKANADVEIQAALRKRQSDISFSANLRDGRSVSASIEQPYDASIETTQRRETFYGGEFRSVKPRQLIPMENHARRTKHRENHKR